MVTRGIVEAVETPYTYKVRLPLINSMEKSGYNTTSEFLNTAVVCTVPNINPGIHVGDVVFVAFEEENMGKPVIIGCLFRENMGSNYLNITTNTLETLCSANLPQDTCIGKITKENINCLSGITQNIQSSINILQEEITKLKKRVESIEENTVTPP